MKKLFRSCGDDVDGQLAAFAETFTAPVVPRQSASAAETAAAATSDAQTSGVDSACDSWRQSAANVKSTAPARYGTAQQSVALKPEEPRKGTASRKTRRNGTVLSCSNFTF